MPSAVHEMLIEMVVQRPSLVAELLVDVLGMDLPVYQVARVESGELTELAAWCATPIQLGYPGASVTPLVVGPDRVPVVTEVDPAGAGPEWAVLSAMAHGADPAHRAVLVALLAALAGVDEQRATLYLDVVLAALPLAARSYLEKLMTTQAHEYQSDFARRYFFQGEAQGEAKVGPKAGLGPCWGYLTPAVSTSPPMPASGSPNAVTSTSSTAGFAERSPPTRSRTYSPTDQLRADRWVSLSTTSGAAPR